jgi:hypothetical protein
MAKQTPFTSQQERLERLIKNARSEVVALKGMIDTARSIVAAQYVKIDDAVSPQVLRVSEGGSLELGNETPFRVIGTVRDQSHTGDTSETVLGTVTIPADSMGPNGFLRIAALFRAIGSGLHTFKVQWGGNDVKRYWLAATSLYADFCPIFIWNKGATNSQETGIMWSILHLRSPESPTTFSEDTTADVDVTFTVQNATAGDTSYLRFALVEAFYSD